MYFVQTVVFIRFNRTHENDALYEIKRTRRKGILIYRLFELRVDLSARFLRSSPLRL